MYGQTIRKRPLFSSAASDDVDYDKQSTGGISLASKKSGAISLRSGRKSMAGSEFGEGLRPDSKWLKAREYLLLLIEASLSLAAYVIRERNFNVDEMKRINITRHQAEIFMHYADGHSAWVSMIIGCLEDSYFTHYTMALVSVIIHFATVCIVFMEYTIKGNQTENPYAAPVRTVCIVALVLIKSTDFTRAVYGVQGMKNRRTSTVYIFIFLQFWVSYYAQYGGVIMNVFAALFNYFKFQMVIVGFVMSGISLFLFVYLLHPETPWKEQRGLGCGVLGCLLLAAYYKIFKVQKRGKRGFLGKTEGTFTKTTVSKTKEILLLYVLLLPTFGVAVEVMTRATLFFDTLIKSVKHEEYLDRVGLIQLARAVLSLSMLLSYFVLWPLMNLLGVKNRSTIKFLFGYLLAVLGSFCAGILTKFNERLQYPYASGFVRVYNTRKDVVVFSPENRDFSKHAFEVHPGEGIMVAYACPRSMLFAMTVLFNGTQSNFTMFLHVAPEQTVGYVVVDPPEVIRIRGPFIPVQEGPPGTNGIGVARIYVYNTAKTLDGSKIIIKPHHQKQLVRDVELQAGIMATISLNPGVYDFSIQQAGIKKSYVIQEGALYGLIIYSTTSSREMTIDEVINPNSASVWPFLSLYFFRGIARGLCYPTLRAIVYSIAPQGLMAMSFAFLAFLEGMARWFLYIGFNTWHCFVTSTVIIVYSAGHATLFFICMFFMLKYKHSYN